MKSLMTLVTVACLVAGLVVGFSTGVSLERREAELDMAKGLYGLKAGPSVCSEVTLEGERVRWYCPEPE